MATSQNGYKANDRSLIASYSVPGGKIAMRKGDVATVLTYVAKRFHSEVEALKWPGNWGYAERKIRGSSTTLSNHASGTAIDLNAPRHPLGRVGTFSSAQKGRVKKILADCGGVVRWGGNYSGRKDEMHFEINASSARVAEVAKAIRAGKKPGPSGGASSEWDTVKGDTPLVEKGDKGEPVKRVQKAVGVKVDGYFGSGTEKAVKAFQKKHGLTADGVVGPDTWKLIQGDEIDMASLNDLRKIIREEVPKASFNAFQAEESDPDRINVASGHRASQMALKVARDARQVARENRALLKKIAEKSGMSAEEIGAAVQKAIEESTLDVDIRVNGNEA